MEHNQVRLPYCPYCHSKWIIIFEGQQDQMCGECEKHFNQDAFELAEYMERQMQLAKAEVCQ